MDEYSTNPSTTSTEQTQPPSKNLPRTQQKTITLAVFLITFISTLLLPPSLTVLLRSSHNSNNKDDHRTHKTPLTTHEGSSSTIFIKNACSSTLYPSLCLSTLSNSSSINNTNNNSNDNNDDEVVASFHHLLHSAINQTLNVAVASHSSISSILSATSVGTHYHPSNLSSQEKNVLEDCLDMLDQTLYELAQAIDDLRNFSSSHDHLPMCYCNLKTLLSAAMTNEHTCITGLEELAATDYSDIKISPNYMGLIQYLQNTLTPISQTISNCLALIKYVETNHNTPNYFQERDQTRQEDMQMLFTKMPRDGFPTWMTVGDQMLMERMALPKMKPNIVVASDGSGQYQTIREAVRMAPSRSNKRFVIQIKAGVYNESVEISREKVNLMLVGDGMNSTIITASRNFADGFSTFTSATLGVDGDKFLARDLTILNTAGPDKHQAVAVRVTSNAAFYRCNFSSYQDTLYAHSLRQFYRECTIQGTVDFIFGNAAAVFQNCLILIRRPIPGQENIITAQGREDPNQNTGISLHNCTIEAAQDFTISERANVTTFLGRPWRNYSRTMVMKSYLGDLINPQGWCKWDQYSTLDTVEYVEYMNFGPGSDTRGRVKWGGYRRNCTEDIAKQFTVEAFFHGADQWLDSTGFPHLRDP
ncbi:probable pectinesterase/pectinesterase inhibitor 40 [Malania oleifera]|uniref:probable pectinesterase/pectinesterase inhibitor 40 n=1 Tax=Malania oleifera TaxID=397392 RepID=UPI0025AE5B03|nr:probable pectinesterase/pectinesterase inhibitor 40 [Malania oleifera]